MKEPRVVAMLVEDDVDEPPPLELECPALDAATAKRLSACHPSNIRSNDNQRDDANEHNSDDSEPSLMDEIVATAQRAKEAKGQQQERERNSQSFGSGLRRGFFAASKPVRTKAPAKTQQKTKAMPTVHVHLCGNSICARSLYQRQCLTVYR